MAFDNNSPDNPFTAVLRRGVAWFNAKFQPHHIVPVELFGFTVPSATIPKLLPTLHFAPHPVITPV
jgi:hypothetical protein